MQRYFYPVIKKRLVSSISLYSSTTANLFIYLIDTVFLCTVILYCITYFHTFFNLTFLFFHSYWSSGETCRISFRIIKAPPFLRRVARSGRGTWSLANPKSWSSAGNELSKVERRQPLATRHFVRLRSEEDETDGLHYARQRESAARRCAIQASRTPAECFCRPVSDFHHRYRKWILFFTLSSDMESICLLSGLFLQRTVNELVIASN